MATFFFLEYEPDHVIQIQVNLKVHFDIYVALGIEPGN